MIIFNGPACGGKSTISKELWNELPKTALISLDDIKWLVSDCEKDNLQHILLAHEIAYQMCETYIKNKKNIIIEKAFCEFKNIEKYIQIAKNNNINHYIFNIEAPLEELEARNQQRNKKIKQTKSNRKQMTKERLIRLFNKYEDNKFSVNKTFDTSTLSEKNIIKEIDELIDFTLVASHHKQCPIQINPSPIKHCSHTK